MSVRRLSWIVMALVLVVALAIGSRADAGSQTDAERAHSLAAQIKCPTCRSQSVADSDAPASEAIRTEIARRVKAGESNGEIRAFFASRYGDEILLTPSASGITGLVWVLPVAALVLGATGLGVAFDAVAPVAELIDPVSIDPVSTDPDALAALEDQLAFLRRSLDDLDREHEAGDLDEDDYRTLRADYAARAARVERAINEGLTGYASSRAPQRRGRLFAGIAGAVVVAVLAGVLVAQAAGRRDPGDNITGDDVRSTTRERLSECVQLGGERKILDALKCYDAVLADQPRNVEAITYRGWFLALAGLPYDAMEYLDRAVEVDPEYPDARAFRAVVLDDLCRQSEAAAELDALDALDPPPDVRALIEPLRQRLDAAANGTAEPCVPPDDLTAPSTTAP